MRSHVQKWGASTGKKNCFGSGNIIQQVKAHLSAETSTWDKVVEASSPALAQRGQLLLPVCEAGGRWEARRKPGMWEPPKDMLSVLICGLWSRLAPALPHLPHQAFSGEEKEALQCCAASFSQAASFQLCLPAFIWSTFGRLIIQGTQRRVPGWITCPAGVAAVSLETQVWNKTHKIQESNGNYVSWLALSLSFSFCLDTAEGGRTTPPDSCTHVPLGEGDNPTSFCTYMVFSLVLLMVQET